MQTGSREGQGKDWREVLHRINGQVLDEMDSGDVGRRGRRQERVTVSGRVGHEGRSCH
jgi:hypothetical protein